MRKKDTNLNLLLATIMLMLSLSLSAQSVDISVTTVTYGGQYAPKNCFAMWITDINGNYVNTINRQGTKGLHIFELFTWKASAPGGVNNVDGITGATLTAHGTKHFTWNCKDANNVLVPDGVYNVNMEFTEINGQGKVISYQFTKGPTNQTPSLTGNAFFANPSIVYTAPVTGINEAKVQSEYSVYEKDGSLTVKYNPLLHASIKLKLYSLSGAEENVDIISDESGSVILNVSGLKGLYFLKITDNKNAIQTRKVIL